MCCLFGLIDTEPRFTGKEKSKLLHALASASEARGTDATGVAYDSGRNLHIYKKPIPGHKLNFYIRDNSRFAMGHTRMTTQGSARKNYNNHPFRGIMQTGAFALAHNGVLDNDISLRKSLHLSRTRIETDSYIAVQLIVQKGILNFDSLRYMAELLEGSFTITVLGDDGSFYIVKGGQPLLPVFLPGLRSLSLCLNGRNPSSGASEDSSTAWKEPEGSCPVRRDPADQPDWAARPGDL